MKTIFVFFLLFAIPINGFSCAEKNTSSRNELLLANKFTSFYNQILTDQAAIQKMNLLRPKIYLYTDFGGGKNGNELLVDLQTSGEISGAAWKGTLQQGIYINDSATPLSPAEAAVRLAKTFPYEEKYCFASDVEEISIQTIVVHVVDPGVGNDLDKDNPQPRSLILRKDGVLFIGPDNGTLSFVCPPKSIAGCWEIHVDALTALSGNDTKVGGTCEAAFRIAAGILSPWDIGIGYKTLELRNRIPIDQTILEGATALKFERICTERFYYDATLSNESELFDKAFLLGTVQSSLYPEDQLVALTTSKRLFLPRKTSENLIAIINDRNGNVFIGPNNGLGSSFIKDFSYEDTRVFYLTGEVLGSIVKENNNEIAVSIIESQPRFHGPLKEIDFFGGPADIIKDEFDHPKRLKAKIWVDLYGNIKTTIPSLILNEAKQLHASINVEINGIKRPAIFAETFSQVPSEQLFIYNGSTGTFGPNPHRSKRYVELTSNGVFGKFGIDFFENEGTKPKSGDILWLEFEYL